MTSQEYANCYTQSGRRDETEIAVSPREKYVPTTREQAFLDTVENPKYDRGIINGLEPVLRGSGARRT